MRFKVFANGLNVRNRVTIMSKCKQILCESEVDAVICEYLMTVCEWHSAYKNGGALCPAADM